MLRSFFAARKGKGDLVMREKVLWFYELVLSIKEIGAKWTCSSSSFALEEMKKGEWGVGIKNVKWARNGDEGNWKLKWKEKENERKMHVLYTLFYWCFSLHVFYLYTKVTRRKHDVFCVLFIFLSTHFFSIPSPVSCAFLARGLPKDIPFQPSLPEGQRDKAFLPRLPK